METLLCILLSPFVLVFTLNYIKKYDPPKRRRRKKKWW